LSFRRLSLSPHEPLHGIRRLSNLYSDSPKALALRPEPFDLGYQLVICILSLGTATYPALRLGTL
jgi:hypothetical protein